MGTINKIKLNFKDEKIFFIIFIAGMLVKYAGFGFRYYPILDDFVQYGFYPGLENVWQNVLADGAKTIYVRPLASVFDIFVWGKMWGILGAALIIITLLHAFSGILLYKTIKRMRLSVSPLFLVIYGFLPMGSEGTYWISASSRVVVSLFFMALSVYFLVKSINEEKKMDLIFYIVTGIMSCCFYESTLVLSLFFSVYIMFFYSDYRKLVYPVSIFVLIAAYYFIFGPMGDNSSRVTVINFPEIPRQFEQIMSELSFLWGNAHALFYTNGIPRSFALITQNNAWWWLALTTCLCIIWIKYCNSAYKNSNNLALAVFQIITGVLLAVVPYIPFLISRNNVLNFRTAVPAFIGAALAADSLLQMILRNKKTFIMTISVVLFVFMVINYSEVYDYTRTGYADMQLAQTIAKEANETVDENTLVYYNARQSAPFMEQNSPFRDHVQSVTGTNNWSLTGAVRAISKNRNIRVLPVIR